MKNVINRALVAKKRNILTLVLAIVSSVWMMSEAQINSLCDEWNVLEISAPSGPRYAIYHTSTMRLSKDTIIVSTNRHYVRLENNGHYKGAMREGANRDIYYIPEGATHEYLLYAFNAKIGDRLSNLWYGGRAEWCPNGYNATVRSISEGTPRVFTIEVEYTYSDSEGEHIIPYDVYWTEGVGMSDGPVGQECTGPMCGCSCGQVLLCTYKNGQQVYVSEAGEKYGCEYNYDGTLLRTMFPSDTRWHYEHSEMYGGPNDNYNFTIQPADIIINNTRYQQISGFLFRSSGAKVWCALDSAGTLVERLVYDFDLQVGDSIPTYYGVYVEEVLEDTYDHSYAKVTNVEHIYLADGRPARRISYDYRPDDIEHIGSVEGILAPLNLPIPTCGCADHFHCCTYAGTLLYEVAKGACDTFFVNLQPTDTIPLYARDDSGSSTVDPVDPNQIYATLTGDKLTVHNNTGAQVTFTLNNTSVNNVAARARANAEPVSFTESISVELSEDGIYEILLTSEEWNYTVFGTVNYIRSGTDFIKDETPTTKKVLRGTQILIEREGKTYTLTGQEIN